MKDYREESANYLLFCQKNMFPIIARLDTYYATLIKCMMVYGTDF